MAETPTLPEPDSESLAALVGSTTQRLVYGLLYRRQQSPPTRVELSMYVADALGEDPEQLDHRLSELRRYFQIDAVEQSGETRFQLTGWSPSRPVAAGLVISDRRRAEILLPQRCAQCGKTPLEDHVKLVVDYKVPLSWGGDSDPGNLQPLCEQCRDGRRDYFKSFESKSEQIRAAIGYAEPQKRIGELLRALAGQWVRSDLIEIVANAQSYQDDWQRRLRDLRFLGWDYKHRKSHDEGARVIAYYKLTRAARWPDNIHAAIRAEEARRAAANKAQSAGHR